MNVRAREYSTKQGRLTRALSAFLALMLASTAAFADDQAFQAGAGGLRFKDMTPGQGQAASPGQVATIHVVGWYDRQGVKGKELINSRRQRGEPVSFVIGTDGVMPAWNEGVKGMKPGGKRILMVPPGMAYGARGVDGEISPNASFIFQIELVGLEDASEP